MGLSSFPRGPHVTNSFTFSTIRRLTSSIVSHLRMSNGVHLLWSSIGFPPLARLKFVHSGEAHISST